jgi:hypothetical protein
VRWEGQGASPFTTAQGETTLVPAACRDVQLVAEPRAGSVSDRSATVLSAYLP